MAERFEIVEKALLKLLEEKKYATLRDILTTMNPMDVAGLFDGLDEKQIPLMFRLLPKEQAAETFVEMEPEAKELLIRGFSDNELKEVLDELYVDDAADIVEEMPANVVQRILKHADPEMRSSINQILRYPEDSAGSIMTTEYVSLRPHMTVEEAILRIRRQGVDKETIYTCYVTEKDRTLIGLVTVKDLLLAADDETKIEDIMETNLISVTTQTDQEEVAATLSKYNFIALPVVDGENRMVGIVTFDDAMDVMQDAATEDMEIMAAMTPSEKTYLKSTPFDLFKHRIPWLMLLMVCAGASEQAVSQWASTFAEQGLKVSKTIGDLAGPMAFSILMGSARAFYGKFGDRIDLDRFMIFSGILCVVSYLCIALIPNAIVSLASCAICGLSVGIMWPGSFSKAAALLKNGGTALFALLALAGDLGCSGGPTLVGMVSSACSDNLKTGILAAIIFPILLVIGLIIMKKGDK